jgi:murein DD-endopeptidase MepM/ murein hydrolase activator NlpD
MSTSESIGQGGYPYDQGQGIDSIYAGVVDSGRSLKSEVAQELAVLGIFLDEVESFEEAHLEQVRTTPSISPLEPTTFVLTSPFGTRRSPFTKKLDAHSGLDMAAETGTAIVAPADGVVVFAGRYPARQSVSWWRYGELVAIQHGDQFITLFGHCDEVLVRTGQRVSQREIIARVGNSGWSTSPHLHYEVRHRDAEGEFVPVDPRVYILDHRWRDQEQFLVAARNAPTLKGYDPLPRLMRR